MYKLIEYIKDLTMSGYSFENVNGNGVHKKVHARYFMRFLNLLPPRLASHDSTKYAELQQKHQTGGLLITIFR